MSDDIKKGLKNTRGDFKGGLVLEGFRDEEHTNRD